MAAALRGDGLAGTREHSLMLTQWDLKVEPSESTVGGGAFPSARIPSFALTIGGDVTALEVRLRKHALPIIAVIREGRLRLDLRSVPEAQDAALGQRLLEALRA